MKKTITQLENIVAEYTPLLRSINIDEYKNKPNPAKWSKIEILGHLIDSAQTNIRRFVVAQYEDQPHLVYRQDDWVKIANYQEYPLADLIQLWALLNKHICIVLSNVPADKYAAVCVTQAPHTIEWLAEDYNKHLLHHLHQVCALEPVAYP